MILQGLAKPMIMLSRRARLACVNRACRRFCAHHATRMRRHTEVVVPVEGWDAYVFGASRWLAWHAIALRTARVRFEVSAACHILYSVLLGAVALRTMPLANLQ